MPEISPSLYAALCQVRATLRTNALHRTWNRQPNQGIVPADLAREAASLRALVEARLGYPQQAVRRPLPLAALSRDYPQAIAGLAEAVNDGEITPADLEAFMTASDFTRPPAPRIPAQAPAPAAEAIPAATVEELEPV